MVRVKYKRNINNNYTKIEYKNNERRARVWKSHENYFYFSIFIGSRELSAAHAQVLKSVDRVRGQVRRGRRPFGSGVLLQHVLLLQLLVGHVLGTFPVARPTIVARREQVLQALPVLVQVHSGRTGDQPQTVGIIVPVRFQHLIYNRYDILLVFIILIKRNANVYKLYVISLTRFKWSSRFA